jgi:ribokinase
MKNIVVIGSINTDMVLRTARIPKAGETLLGHSFISTGGGKGANQAVAAARLSGQVCLVGKIGDDNLGKTAIDNFRKEKLDTNHISVDQKLPSGVAFIVVDEKGENMIVVAPGANGGLTREEVQDAEAVIRQADIVLLQLEIPLETVLEGMILAKKHHRMVVLNPAPAARLSDEFFRCIDIIVPNQPEAQLLTGIQVNDNATAQSASMLLHEKGIPAVVITMGERGAYVSSKYFSGLVPGFNAGTVVDTVAAGDTFCAALAIGISEGNPIEKAVEFANAAAAISVTRHGAQDSGPYRREVDELLRR